MDYENKGYAFRFQPKGSDIEGYESMGYTHDIEVSGGVWAFNGVMNAVRNMYDPMESYASELEDQGNTPELVVLRGNIEDGPEDFVRVHSPQIVDRISVTLLRQETDLFYDEDEEELSDQFLDFLSGITSTPWNVDEL